jgi:hypothetical protein
MAKLPTTRTARRAVVTATVCCLFTALNSFGYWTQQVQEGFSPAWEMFVNVTLLVSLVSSLVGAGYAVRIGAGGIRHRRRRDLHMAGWVLVGSMTPWISFWIADLINDHLRAGY